MTTLHKVTMYIPFDGDPGSVLDAAVELAVQLTGDAFLQCCLLGDVIYG